MMMSRTIGEERLGARIHLVHTHMQVALARAMQVQVAMALI